MEEYIDQIEEFLRGQMSHDEESVFKSLLAKDKHLHSLAFIIAFMMKAQKSG